MFDLAKKAVELLDNKKFELVECRCEKINSLMAHFTEEGVKDVMYSEDYGLSVRVLKNGYWYFSVLSNPDRDSLNKFIDGFFLNGEILGKGYVNLKKIKVYQDKVEVKVKQTLLNSNIEEIVEIPFETFNKLKKITREDENYIKSYDINFMSAYIEQNFVNSEGAEITQYYPFQRLSIRLSGLRNGKLARAAESVGGPRGLESFNEDNKWNPEYLLEKTLNRVNAVLNGEQPPKGNLPIVMDPSMTGTLIHEAFGHLCEADLVFGGGAIKPEHIGNKIANDNITIVDDPLNESGGWVPYDQEGVKSEKSILVENGILKEFMVNREYATKLNQPCRGNARATNYSFPPIIRMRNTYLKSGDYSFDEILEDIKFGIYIEKFIGGQASLLGTFQFTSQIGWLIENGEITKPLKDVTISGSTFETLKSIEAVGKNFETDIGICGKGQWVTVGDGG
ncbi:MAG: TldD/PmbA family protein, partial [Candidatus Odinarchaeia archaeon]